MKWSDQLETVSDVLTKTRSNEESKLDNNLDNKLYVLLLSQIFHDESSDTILRR